MSLAIRCETLSFPIAKNALPGHRRHRICPKAASHRQRARRPLPPFRLRCSLRDIWSEEWLAKASPYEVLGVDESCTLVELKAAFRARVKEFHPDVCKDARVSEAIIRRVIRAYEILSNDNEMVRIIERECKDPFEEPECEAIDLFIDETRCIGSGCPYSCVKRAPHAFSFNPMTGAACASSQGHVDDYIIQLAVGQCPRNCIYFVTPLQREILEEILNSILSSPYASPEVDSLSSLLAKAKYENNRYQKPKRAPKGSTQFVDWF